MNRLLLIGSLAALLVGSTGCLHHNTRGGCKSCSTGNCNTGECGQCQGGCNECSSCGHGGCRTGCTPGRLGWQQGGHDYSAHLKPGLLGHHAGDALNSRPFTPGPPTAAVGYPYYTVRGPRDFLLDNPPSIGN